MTKRRSPYFDGLPEGGAEDPVSSDEDQFELPPPSSADFFALKAATIRGKHDEVAKLREHASGELQAMISPLKNDPRASRYPRELQHILVNLVSIARGCMKERNYADFYIALRRKREEEDARPSAQKLLFLERLADFLQERTFFIGRDAWQVSYCTQEMLKEPGPRIPSKMTAYGGVSDAFPVHLVEILAGIRI